jgi:curli biogenesis system outer membrane secretion channel CsgG
MNNKILKESIMEKRTIRRCAAFAVIAAASCGAALAQPTFGNPSPNAGSSTSQDANAAADQAAYKEVEYTNKARRGPALVVIPGEIKSNNSSFLAKIAPNNIADFGELELSNANFPVLERSNLGPLLNEISLAYNLGDAAQARKTMQVGKLKTTKWIVKFDILKAEQIAENKKGFDGGAVGSIISGLGGFGRGSYAAGTAVGSVQTQETSGVWLIGMRYKIMDATTTEQVAQGYKELKMEVGANSTSVLGISQGAKGGVGLDTMVQRLVQTAVWDIDKNYK